MLTGLPLLESTDWSKLRHAHGRATETPGHLRALLEEDPEAREKALSHLWTSVLQESTPWTVTGPAALVVAGFLADERIDRGQSIRPDLLTFLAGVAEASRNTEWSIEELQQRAAFDIEALLDAEDEEAVFESDESADSFDARSYLGCINAGPAMMEVLTQHLAHSDPSVRACAAMGAVALARTEALSHTVAELESRLLKMVRDAEDDDEACAHLMALGDLGYRPVTYLDDTSPPVRMCAALARNLDTNTVAIHELLMVLEKHAEQLDNWFGEIPPQFALRPRFPVVARLIQQVKDFDRLVNAAVAVIRITDKYSVDLDWGPLLAAAFPDCRGTVRTEAQRRFLSELVKRTEFWDPGLGNAYKWFQKAGLPFNRDECAKRVETK